MSVYSQARKVRQKGTVRELKVVPSVTRRGADTLKTEEVKTPGRDRAKASSSNRANQSSSPTKRRKLDGFDAQPLPLDFVDSGEAGKRQTLVFIPL